LVKKTIFAILSNFVDKMSVIQTIRNKYLGLMVAIIVVALVGFLVMDGLQSNAGNLFGGGGDDRTTIAEVGGRKINAAEFDALKEKAMTNFRNKNPKATEQELRDAEQEAYGQFISDQLMDDEFKKLGLQVTDKEFQEMLTGQFAAPFIQQNFRNADGQFDPSAVKSYVTQVRSNRNKDAKAGQAYEEWKGVEKQLERERLVQKYTTMIGLGINQPKAVTDAVFKEREAVSSISYVMIPYDSVKENVTVTDADYQAYVKKYGNAFTIEQELRKIEYVSWNIVPTAADSAKSLGVINSLAGTFASTQTMEEFLGSNGADELYDNLYHASGEFTSPAIDSLMSRAVGTVVGPFYDNGTYRLCKVMDKAVLPDSAKASAIVIPMSEGVSDDEASTRADSIARIATAANFTTLVNMYGDEQSKAKGGDIGYLDIREGNNTNELFLFLQGGKVGQIKKVKQGGAYIVVLITDQKSMRPKAKIACFAKKLTPSKETRDRVLATVTSAVNGVTTKAAFDKAIKDKGLTKRVAETVAESQFDIEGLGEAREVIRYAFGTDPGKVSSILSLNGNDKYVVCMVSEVYPKGLAPISLVRQNLQAELTKQKKFESLAAKYKGKSLDAIASGSGQQIMKDDSVSITGMQTALSQEAKVIGAAFNKANTGKVSAPIYGKTGAYFITVNNIGARNLNVTEASKDQEAQMYRMQSMQNIGRALPEILRRRAKVVDNRGKFL
jgi:peptidyl-prolyl cis-trans isomerase D